MNPHLLVTAPIAATVLEKLSEQFSIHQLSDAGVMEKHAADIQALLTNSIVGVQKSLLDQLPNLRMIACSGVGVDGIDLTEAARRNIAVSNTPTVLNEAVADLALTLLLGVTRRVVQADRFVREGTWATQKWPLADGIQGKICGIVGLGGIGTAIAKRVEAFGMGIAYHTRHAKNVPYRHYDNLETMARAVDVLVLALPANASTHHVVNARILNALGPKGYLINIARGAVVDEVALIEALERGTIAGAGLDVFENEPHVPPAFFRMDNVVLLPHIGSATHETRLAMATLAGENLLAFFSDKPLLTPVTK